MPAEHYRYILVEREKWWNSCHDKTLASGCDTVFESRDQYDSFIEGRKSHFARFKNLQELEKPVSWKDLSAVLRIKKMPNGRRYLSGETVNSLLRMEL